MYVGNLKLEKFSESDFESYYELVSNEKVMAMITGKGLTIDEAKLSFQNKPLKNNSHPTFGFFQIKDKSNGRFMGLCKLELDKTSTEVELGYMLLPEYWGLGITGRIAKHLIETAKSDGQIKKVFAIIDPDNQASRKILTNNGFVSKEFRNFDSLPGERLELEF